MMKELIKPLLVAVVATLCLLACSEKQQDIEPFLKREIVAEFAKKRIDAKILKNSLELVPDGKDKFKGSVGVVIDNELYEHDLFVSIEGESVRWRIKETETSVIKREQKRAELRRKEAHRQEMTLKRQEEERRREEAERHRYDWLQGHWCCNTNLGTHNVIIEGNKIYESIGGNDYDVNTFEIENGRLGYTWHGMYVYFDIDERNKRIGCDGQYYHKTNNSNGGNNSNYAYSSMFYSSQDVYGVLLNHSFRSGNMVIKFDGNGNIYFGSQCVSRGFTVSSLSNYSATILFRFEYDGSMTRLRVELDGNSVILVDPVDGTIFR